MRQPIYTSALGLWKKYGDNLAEWQEELDEMSEFLLIKSTEEQKEEGVEIPVDTAFVGE